MFFKYIYITKGKFVTLVYENVIVLVCNVHDNYRIKDIEWMELHGCKISTFYMKGHNINSKWIVKDLYYNPRTTTKKFEMVIKIIKAIQKKYKYKKRWEEQKEEMNRQQIKWHL